MPEIEVGEEQEGPNCWSYDVTVFDGGRTHRYAVTLSWSDYDLWSGGSAPPSKVIERAFLFLLDNEPPTAIMSKFDCSVIRRYFPEVDAWMKKRGAG